MKFEAAINAKNQRISSPAYLLGNFLKKTYPKLSTKSTKSTKKHENFVAFVFFVDFIFYRPLIINGRYFSEITLN